MGKRKRRGGKEKEGKALRFSGSTEMLDNARGCCAPHRGCVRRGVCPLPCPPKALANPQNKPRGGETFRARREAPQPRRLRSRAAGSRAEGLMLKLPGCRQGWGERARSILFRDEKSQGVLSSPPPPPALAIFHPTGNCNRSEHLSNNEVNRSAQTLH